MYASSILDVFFFFNDTATTEIYTLSLHDALPIWAVQPTAGGRRTAGVAPHSGAAHRGAVGTAAAAVSRGDRKSTPLKSSHANISYAVFFLKKKKTQECQQSR